MIYIRFENEFNFEYDIQALIRGFYPGEELKSIMPGEALVAEACDETVKFVMSFCYLVCEDAANRDKLILKVYDRELNLTKEVCVFTDYSDRVETKNILKRLIYDVLYEITGKTLPWGTLSGIRPTKITSKMLADGMSKEDVKRRIKDTYYISDKKADLSIKVSENELNILKDIDYKRGYSVYIGIPFCPTTCLYCSFTSYPISAYKIMVKDYLDAVIKEIDFVSKEFADMHMNTIYIGGGTPTTLEPDMLDYLMTAIREKLDFSHNLEFTVEAGRPDSITREKLEVLKKHNVTRISVNPQTMKQKTLDIIGRRHTVEQVREAFLMAKEAGFDNINMDFIVGLPEETIDDIRMTMEETKLLKPDSITIHSLAVKRAARLNIFKEEYDRYAYNNSEEIMTLTYNSAAEMGMEPYYLYRQKNMTGNMENVGYSVLGKAGIYNILIMEEKHPIIALGAGASTKIVYPGEEKIERVENVKDVKEYISRVDEMIERKRKAVCEWKKSLKTS